MKTHEQQTSSPHDRTRRLTRDLADLCKRDGAAFAQLVREGDAVDHRGDDTGWRGSGSGSTSSGAGGA